MGFLLLLLIISVTEIYFLIKFGEAIGALRAVAIILSTAVAGIILARLELYSILGKIKKQFEENQNMTDSALELVFILFGALLMILPGFITDIIGLLMILPFTRMYFVARVSPGFRQRIENTVEEKKKEFYEKKKKKEGGAA